MSGNLKGKYFIASRGFYGTNSVSYMGIEIEVTKYNHDYADPVTSFDWGSSEKASTLLAYVMLNTIATPTIARVYANKYRQAVIEHIKEDEWKMEAIEVAQWINTNTDYTINLDEEDEKKAELEEIRRREEAIAKERRKIEREKEFQEQIEEKLKKRNHNTHSSSNVIDHLCSELHIKYETLARILDIPMETINNWRLENEIPKLARKAIEFYKAGIIFKEKNSKLKIEAIKFQEELTKMQSEINLNATDLKKYRKIISSLDIPNLYKMYKEL